MALSDRLGNGLRPNFVQTPVRTCSKFKGSSIFGIILETAVEDDKLTQSFELESLLMGGRLHLLGIITPYQKRF
jgi:hypothetical protein